MAGRRTGSAASWRVVLAASLIAGLLCLLSASALASTAPGSNSLRQQCIKAALVMPKVKHAYMVNPGKRPYEDDPHVVGPIQSTHVLVDYPEVAPTGQPGECDEDVIRVESGKLQKREAGSKKWKNVPYHGWRHADNGERIDGIEQYDSVHGTPERVYWHPGERYRVLMTNKAKDPQTRKVLGARSRPIPVQIRRGKRSQSSTTSKRA